MGLGGGGGGKSVAEKATPARRRIVSMDEIDADVNVSFFALHGVSL